MSLPLEKNYKLEYTRYRHYFHNLWSLYQQPAVKVSSALLLTLFTIIFFAAFAIRPTLVTVAELVKKIDDQQKVLDQMKQKSAALASAQQDYLAAQDKIPVLNQAVPGGEEIQGLIKMIEGTAAFHNLPLDAFSVGDVVFVPSSAPHPAGLQSRPLSLSVSGDYLTLKSFLADLIRIPRSVSVESVAYSGSAQNQAVSGKLQMTVNFTVYFLPKDSLATK